MNGLRRLADQALGGAAISAAVLIMFHLEGEAVIEPSAFAFLGVGSVALYLGIRLGLYRRRQPIVGQGYTARREGVDEFLEGIEESETLRESVEAVDFRLTEEQRERALDESPTFAGAFLEDEARRRVGDGS